jgi:hypothetical protein
MKKHEIAVFIENEEMLREARELLEKYGEDMSDDDMYLDGNEWDYLQLSFFGWIINIQGDKELTTLPQLEEILKTEKG